MSLINDALIKVLKENTPNKENTVNLLMNIVPLGKEAAYRRLRGEIPFTLDEASLICKQLNISLDSMLGMESKESYNFQLKTIMSKSPLDGLHYMTQEVTNGLEYIAISSDSISYRAYRSLPFEFFFKYRSLSKVYIYIFFYQLHAQSTSKKLLEIDIPEDVFARQRKMSSALLNVASVIILDKHIIQDFIEIVKYLESMGIISEDNIAEIKTDLHSMLDDLEKCALTGLSPNRKKMDIYISHISYDCTYAYMEGGGYQGCSISIYCIDHISCSHPDVCENQRLWIKSLIRFSTLISVSGELQRNEYFLKQRDLVNSIL